MLTQEELVKNGKDYCMPPTKIMGFLEEIPWVRKLVSGNIRQVYAQKAESTLLTYRLQKYDYGIVVPEYQHEEFFLLDEHGEMVSFKEEKTSKLFFDLFGPVVTREKTIRGWGVNSTVNSVIQKVWDKADSVRYLLSYYPRTGAVIVYKLPKNTSLRQWFADETQRERNCFREEIRAIG